MAAGSVSLVLLTQDAKADLASIAGYSTLVWGEAQAMRYLAMLADEMQVLVEDLGSGTPVENIPGVLRTFVRWKRAKHGHNIVFTREQGGIVVLRILHSASDLPTAMLGDSDQE